MSTTVEPIGDEARGSPRGRATSYCPLIPATGTPQAVDRRSWWRSPVPTEHADDDDEEDRRATLHMTEPSLCMTHSPVEDFRRGSEPAWQSLNFDEFINDLSIEVAKRWRPRSKRVCFGYSGRTLARWIVTWAIGITMGGVAIGLARASEFLIKTRNSVVTTYGFWAFMAWGTGFSFVAASLVAFFAPGASGSGIPIVKAYLNGVKLEACLSGRVFAAKSVGTVLAVGSGASLGPEGPLVHLGAIIGSFCTGGMDPARFCAALRKCFPIMGSRDSQSSQHPVDDKPPKFFRNDVDRRDFLSIGAACGFAAAFGAPIGGVLFSLEEASSFWSNELLWRSLVGAVLSTFTALALEHGIVGLSEISRFGLISLRQAESDGEVSLALLPIAAVAGLCGGILGAAFNAVYYRIMLLRKRFGKENFNAKASIRVLDATLGVAVTSALFYGACLLCSPWACVPRNDAPDDMDFVRKFNCEDGHVHELASLLLGSRERAIKKILQTQKSDLLSARALAYSGGLTLGTLALSFGSVLPGGNFLPLIFCGAALGGAAARTNFVRRSPLHVARRHMSVLGAVALLAGVQRTTVSLCVIMLEGTGNVSLLIPIIVVVCSARFSGNLIGDGLYELTMKLQNVPFLDKHVARGLDDATVKDLCEKTVVSLPRRPTARLVTNILKRSNHGAYPVVDYALLEDSTHVRKLAGLVLREHLAALLKIGRPAALARRLAMPPHDTGASNVLLGSTSVNPLFFNPRASLTDDTDVESVASMAYRTLPSAEDPPRCDENDDEPRFDLNRVMVRSPYVVYDDCPLSRAYRLFVTMGARHLLVVTHHGDLVGILTRHDMFELTHHEDADDDANSS